MKRIEIEGPMWLGNASRRTIGIAEFRMDSSLLQINILYKTKKRGRLYPDPYYITRRDAFKYPQQRLKGGVVVRLVPIDDLKKEPYI